MYAKSCLAATILIGLRAVAVGAEAQNPPLVYELTIDGQTFEVKDSTTVELTIQGKSVQASVRIKPIQHYATDAIEFDYDKSLTLRDDFDKEARTVKLMHGVGASIVITDLGPARADGPRAALADYAEEMEKRLKQGVCKDLRKTFAMPVALKRARGFSTTLTYKDEDDDEQVCRILALESKGRRFAVIVQYGSAEKEEGESLAKITLESITGRQNALRVSPVLQPPE
jgi:hypothetical protein